MIARDFQSLFVEQRNLNTRQPCSLSLSLSPAPQTLFARADHQRQTEQTRQVVRNKTGR